MKYKLFRSLGDLAESIQKHELVAVEYGQDIYAVTGDLIRDVREDLAGLPEYAGWETAAYAPEPVEEYCVLNRYQFEMLGIVSPPNADHNILIDYGVIEEAEE